MARSLRIEFPGAIYHVTSRGNARRTVGRRSDDASRAVAAYLARRRFGHPAGEVAKALGYRSGSSVTRAVTRVESGTKQLQRTAAKLEGRLH